MGTGRQEGEKKKIERCLLVEKGDRQMIKGILTGEEVETAISSYKESQNR